jgi:hypothetical protein
MCKYIIICAEEVKLIRWTLVCVKLNDASNFEVLQKQCAHICMSPTNNLTNSSGGGGVINL